MINAIEWIIGGHHWFNVSGSITLRYRTNFTSSSCKDYLGIGIQSQKMDDLILQSKGEGRMEEGLRFLLTLVAGDMTKSQLVVVVNQPSRVELSYWPFCSTPDPALEPDLSFKDLYLNQVPANASVILFFSSTATGSINFMMVSGRTFFFLAGWVSRSTLVWRTQ